MRRFTTLIRFAKASSGISKLSSFVFCNVLDSALTTLVQMLDQRTLVVNLVNKLSGHCARSDAGRDASAEHVSPIFQEANNYRMRRLGPTWDDSNRRERQAILHAIGRYDGYSTGQATDLARQKDQTERSQSVWVGNEKGNQRLRGLPALSTRL